MTSEGLSFWFFHCLHFKNFPKSAFFTYYIEIIFHWMTKQQQFKLLLFCHSIFCCVFSFWHHMKKLIFVPCNRHSIIFRVLITNLDLDRLKSDQRISDINDNSRKHFNIMKKRISWDSAGVCLWGGVRVYVCVCTLSPRFHRLVPIRDVIWII